MNCASCRKSIAGNFLKVGSLAFHPACFVCGHCRKPIAGSFATHGSRFLHPACFDAHFAPRCVVCQERLTGTFLKHARGPVHEACYAKALAPRCAACHEPLPDKFVRFEGKDFHERCYAKHHAKTCDVCAKAIVGTALTDYWGHTYHAEHERELGACLYCSRLTHASIGGGGLKYPDGRIICRLCHKTAVHRPGDAQRTVQAVRERMAIWGVDLEDIDVPVHVVDRTRLGQLLGRSHAGVKLVSGLAVMNWQRDGRQAKNKQAAIYLLDGMPLRCLEATAAHELMHVWNFHRCPPHNFEFEEGACNYMSYRIHAEKGDEMARYHIHQLETDTHPAYGAGFRRIKKYVDRHGFGRLLSLLQRSKDFPLLDAIF